MAEIECVDNTVPHICTPDTSLADIAESLAHSAWSCLANTPNGLPSNGFYVWVDRPSMACCDVVVVSLEDTRRFKMGEFGQEILNVVGDDCAVVHAQHELDITLMRPCSPVIDEDGQMVKSEVRNEFGKRFLTDVQTLLCCITEVLRQEMDPMWLDSGYYIRPARYDQRATCMSVTFPVVIGGDGRFVCCGCEEAAPLALADEDITPTE